MHRGCFVWTPMPRFAGRRTPRPGPMRVCVCAFFLAWSGGLASRARSGAPHLSFCCRVLLLCLAPSGLGLPLLVRLFASFLFWSFLFFFPFLSLPPCCFLLSLVFSPGCPGPWHCVAPSPRPPRFFFSFFPSVLVYVAAGLVWCLFPPALFFPFPPIFFSFLLSWFLSLPAWFVVCFLPPSFSSSPLPSSPPP